METASGQRAAGPQLTRSDAMPRTKLCPMTLRPMKLWRGYAASHRAKRPWPSWIGAAIGLAACTNTSSMPPAPPAPPPELAHLGAPPPYRLQVGDILAVRLMLNPELNEEVTVRPDGRISTTVAHDEMAMGRTVPQLDRALEREYAKQLKDPHLSVVVKSFAPTRIYVGGEVANPGEFVNVGPPLTVAQALTRAGGDVRLAPYDVVYVPRTGVGEVYKFFNQYVQQFVPVSWGFSYALGPGATVH